MQPTLMGLYSAFAVDMGDLTTELPTLLGYGIIGPAMFWAYRTVLRSNAESESKAWTIVKRLEDENERLQKRINSLRSQLDGGGPGEDSEGGTHED